MREAILGMPEGGGHRLKVLVGKLGTAMQVAWLCGLLRFRRPGEQSDF